MKLALRRVGGSLGVLVPKATLDRWGLSEGDALELGDNSIRPPRNAQDTLDELKRTFALEVVRRFTAPQIRAKILANLHRWKAAGAWIPAYDGWKKIAESGDDGALFAAMLGMDDDSNRLRQSAPWVGLLPKDVVRRLNEEATA